ncbi:hypothetical protein JJBFEOPA_02130 [Mannheimia haemolytica]
MTFHHGSETERVNGGSVPVSVVDSAIIGIVGTAPIGAVNELTVCLTKKDFAKFGTILNQGFTLPDAFDILARYAAGKVYVVNVLDPSRHRTTVTDEVLTLDRNTLTAQTAKTGIIAVTRVKDGANVLNADRYSVDLQTGVVTFVSAPSAPKISYIYADPSKVTEEDIKAGWIA